MDVEHRYEDLKMHPNGWSLRVKAATFKQVYIWHTLTSGDLEYWHYFISRVSSCCSWWYYKLLFERWWVFLHKGSFFMELCEWTLIYSNFCQHSRFFDSAPFSNINRQSSSYFLYPVANILQVILSVVLIGVCIEIRCFIRVNIWGYVAQQLFRMRYAVPLPNLTVLSCCCCCCSKLIFNQSRPINKLRRIWFISSFAHNTKIAQRH